MSDYDIKILNGNDFLITQFYGENPSDYVQFGLPFHIGIDFVSLSGNDWNIESVNSGKVLYAGWANGGYGNVVIILQDDNVLSKYMHLDSVFVSVNQRVNQGQEIGVIGNTGNSTGRHCHLECSTWDGNIWSISNHFDPIPYLNKLDDDIKNQATTNNMTDQLFNATNTAINELQKVHPSYYSKWGRAFGNTDKAKQGLEPLIWIKEMCDEISWKFTAYEDTISEKTTLINSQKAELKELNDKYIQTTLENAKIKEKEAKTQIGEKTVQNIINEAIKTAPAIIEVTSSNKKWYQSKKFWALILGLGANIGMIIYPTQAETIMSLNALIAVYLTGQSVIDYNNK